MKHKKERCAFSIQEREGFVPQYKNLVGIMPKMSHYGEMPGRSWVRAYGTVRRQLMRVARVMAWISLDLIGLIKAVLLAASLPSSTVSLVLVGCSLISIKTHFPKGMLVTQSQKHSGKLVEGWGFFSVISTCLYSNRSEIFGSSICIQICFGYVSMEHSTQIYHLLNISNNILWQFS